MNFMLKFYVYQHTIGPHIYIGKGSGDRVFLHTHSRTKKYIAAYKKYGCLPEILAYFFTEDAAYEYEEFKISELKKQGFSLLNLSSGGRGIREFNHSGVTKKKMKESRRGEKNNFYGRKHSEESKEKIRNKKKNIPSKTKGIPLSEETKRKLREANSGEKSGMYGKPSPMRGRKHSEETKAKMSKSHSAEKNHFYGKKHPPEVLERIASALRGKPLSEAHKEKLRDAKASSRLNKLMLIRGA